VVTGGPNLLRNFYQLKNVSVKTISDLKESNLGYVNANYPNVRTTKDYREVIENITVDAVAIATPAETHFSLVEETLFAGKHVLVEKPLATTTQDAKKLIALSESNQKKY